MLNLKSIRQARGLSQVQLAEKAGVSRRTVEDIERRGDCRISTASALCAALGCTLDELYTPDQTEA